MQMMKSHALNHLKPYAAAVKEHGDNFPALLWASRRTQSLRFDAIASMFDMEDQVVLDAGCGLGDFLPHLLNSGVNPKRYIGLEAIPQLAHRARDVVRDFARNSDQIIEGDFVTQESLLACEADVIVFSGSLNTIVPLLVYRTLEVALSSASAVVFNFLASPDLAAAEHLYSYDALDMLAWAKAHSRHAVLRNDYLPGDATIAMFT